MNEFVLFASTKVSRTLKYVGWSALLLSLPALWWWPLWAAFVLTGAMLLLISSRIVTPETQCVLCRRERAVVFSLIAGPHASVCDVCAVIAAAVATTDQLTRSTSKSTWVMSVLNVMPTHTPNAVSAGALELAWNTEGVDRIAVLLEADRLSNAATKVKLYETLETRSSTEWINFGAALNTTGRHAEALEATRRATEDASAPWRLNNLAAITLRAGVADAELEALLANVERARTMLLEQKPHSWEQALPVFDTNLAELQVRLGRPERALQQLEQIATLNVRALLTKHAALTALGRHDEAKVVAVEAKSRVHPDAFEAKEVNALISSP